MVHSLFSRNHNAYTNAFKILDSMNQSFLLRRLFSDYVDISLTQKSLYCSSMRQLYFTNDFCLKRLTHFKIYVIVYFRKYLNSMPNYKVCIRLFFNKKKYLDSTTYLPIPDNPWISYCLTHSLGIVPFSIFCTFLFVMITNCLLNVIILIWLYFMLHKY